MTIIESPTPTPTTPMPSTTDDPARGPSVTLVSEGVVASYIRDLSRGHGGRLRRTVAHGGPPLRCARSG